MMINDLAPKSTLLGQQVLTLPSFGDVLVMVFSDCIMYVRGEMMDGDYFHFKPEDWIQMACPMSPERLMPLSDTENRYLLRMWLYSDYSAALSGLN